MHDGMPYRQNQGQGQGHSREVDRQSPTGLIFVNCLTTTAVCLDTATATSASAKCSDELVSRRKQLKVDRRGLPVYRARNDLLRRLHGCTAIVIGETGSGKTTQIPQVWSFLLSS